ncbi:MAG: M56 family metallopeptidase [Lachnospiraceae bacterium]|nr:M56 family metallopeptidase [Lachnospiraceae bacterium]
MSELMGNILLNSLILSLLIVIILMLTPLLNGYSRRWRYVAFFVIGLKLLVPVSFIPGNYGIQIPLVSNEVDNTVGITNDNAVKDNNIHNDGAIADKSVGNNSINKNTNINDNEIIVDKNNIFDNENVDNNSDVNNAGVNNINGNNAGVKNATANDNNSIADNLVPNNPNTQNTESNNIVESAKNTIKNISVNTLLQYVLIIWASVASVLMLAYILIYQYHKRNIKRWSVPVEDSELINLFESEKSALGINTDIAFLQCRKINTPMAVGIINPCILIPFMDDYSGLRYILRHELVHQKRHDMYTKVFYVIVKCVQWFNPLVRLMVKHAYDDIEFLCDDEVVRSLEKEQRIQYNESLLNIVKIQCEYTKAENVVFSFGLIQDNDDLRKRMINIMNMKIKKSGHIITALLVATVILGGSLVVCGSSSDNNSSSKQTLETTGNTTNDDTESTKNNDEAINNDETSDGAETKKTDENTDRLETIILNNGSTLPALLTSALENKRSYYPDTTDESSVYWGFLWEAVHRLVWSHPSFIDGNDEFNIISEEELAQIGAVYSPKPFDEYSKNYPEGIEYHDGKYYIPVGDPGEIYYLIDSKTINENGEMVIKGTTAPTRYLDDLILYNYELVIRYLKNNRYEYQIVSMNLSETDEYIDYLKSGPLNFATNKNRLSIFTSAAVSVEAFKESEPSAKMSPYWTKIWYYISRCASDSNKELKIKDSNDYWIVNESDVEQIGKVFSDEPLSENKIPDGYSLVKYKNGKYYFLKGDSGINRFTVDNSTYDVKNDILTVTGHWDNNIENMDGSEKEESEITFKFQVKSHTNIYGYQIINTEVN